MPRKTNQQTLKIADVHTPSSILAQFKKESKAVFSNAEFIDKAIINVEVKKQDIFACLAYRGRPRAIGGTLCQIPSEMTLRVSPEALRLPESQFRGILRHEAIHIGYPRHDRDFRELAAQCGAPLSGSMATTDGGYKVQMKKGSRYTTVRTTPSLDEAKEYAKHLQKASRVRVRIVY
jgi:predicted SprT family Zn-dependent metalloprotease